MQPICKLYEGWQRYEDETGGCAGTKRFRLKNSIIAQHLKAHFSHSQLLLIRRFSWSYNMSNRSDHHRRRRCLCLLFFFFSLCPSFVAAQWNYPVQIIILLCETEGWIMSWNILIHSFSLCLHRLGCLVDHHRSGRVRESVVHKWKMELCCWRRSLLLYCCCRHRQNLAIEVCASHAIK